MDDTDNRPIDEQIKQLDAMTAFDMRKKKFERDTLLLNLAASIIREVLDSNREEGGRGN